MKTFLAWWIVFLLSASPVLADSQGSATGGTAGTQSTLSGCIYNSSPPSLVSGQQVGQQCDAGGHSTSSVTAPAATAAPATTPGTYYPLSLDVHNQLRVLSGNPDGTVSDPSLPNIIAGYGATSGAYSQISVANTATLLFANAASTHFRKICNLGAATIFYGYDINVTTSTGTPLFAGACTWDDVNVWTGTYYGIVVTGTITASVMGN